MIGPRRTATPGIYLVQPKFPLVLGHGALHRGDALCGCLPPLGLLTLAALDPPDYRVTVCDENAGEAVNFETDAEIVGITAIIQIESVFEIADRFRALGKTVVIGGPIANLLPDECRALRRALRGRGRVHLAAIPPRARPGPGNRPLRRTREDPPARLASARLDVLRKRYAHGIVQCTRGCPFTCEFCDIIVMYGRKMRYKPVEQALGEVQAWHRQAWSRSLRRRQLRRQPRLRQELLRALAAGTPIAPSAVVLHPGEHRHGARRRLLGLLRDANFISVFIGIESPRKASLAETHKTQNEKLDLVEAVHKIQSYNLFISAGMIVGFDHDDASIFDEQYEFLQQAQIPIVMLSVLLAVPKTPLYNRLKAAGRLLNASPNTSGVARYVGTAGGTNFHPLGMTREELKRGQERLYRACTRRKRSPTGCWATCRGSTTCVSGPSRRAPAGWPSWDG
jgi:radical SAM superfamily enzyme YgiQ (UPF0313 family)